MGWLDSVKSLVDAVETEYDRRIRSASNVKQYKAGGHGGHASHDGHGDDHPHEVERLQGEGGALGASQANAGPQFNEPH